MPRVRTSSSPSQGWPGCSPWPRLTPFPFCSPFLSLFLWVSEGRGWSLPSTACALLLRHRSSWERANGVWQEQQSRLPRVVVLKKQSRILKVGHSLVLILCYLSSETFSEAFEGFVPLLLFLYLDTTVLVEQSQSFPSGFTRLSIPKFPMKFANNSSG